MKFLINHYFVIIIFSIPIKFFANTDGTFEIMKLILCFKNVSRTL